MLSQSSSLVFANTQWLWVAIILAMVGLALLIIGYTRSALRGIWLLVAVLLKSAAIALLALALLEPVWVDEYPRYGANDLVMMVDNSSGLSLADRGEAIQGALTTAAPDMPPEWLAELERLFRLQRYQVDRRLTRVDDFSGLDFTGQASSLVTSLRSITARYEKRPLAATVLVTDGNATDSDALASLLEKIEAQDEPRPIYPVVVGEPLDHKVRDLAIDSIEVSQSAFEDAPLTLRLRATARGTFESGIQIYVTNERGEELHVEPIIFPGEGGELRQGTVRAQLAAVAPGISFYTVGLRQVVAEGEEPDTEITEANNTRVVAIDRGRGPYRVLYVGGRPNWEYKFLRRAISGDAEIDLVALLRIAKREPKFEWRGRTGETGNPLFRGFGKDIPEETQSYDEPVLIRLNTRDEEELRDGFPRDIESLYTDYRAVIFDDVESDFLSAEQQKNVESFVTKRGGTVIMLGGQESFQKGDWDDTPMARMLPVYLDRTQRGGPAQFATFDLSREGWIEPWMRLRDSQEEETNRLAYMPEFFSINQVPSIKPGASLLATVTDRQKRQHPAIVVQRYGEGRTGAVTVGDFWRWGMKDAELQADLAKMWRQLIRWAVAEAPERLTQELSQVSEGTLPMAKINARVRTETYEPQDDATVSFQLSIPGSSEPKSLSGEPSLEEAGIFTTDSFYEEPGGYRLTTLARDGEGKTIGELETGWAFNPAADEYRRLDPDRELLEQLAQASGGKVLELGEIGSLVDRLKDLNAPVMDTKQRPFWHAPWVFFVALLCLVGEWAIRRWKGGTL